MATLETKQAEESERAALGSLVRDYDELDLAKPRLTWAHGDPHPLDFSTTAIRADVTETTAGEIVVTADLPGLSPDHVRLYVQDGILNIAVLTESHKPWLRRAITEGKSAAELGREGEPEAEQKTGATPFPGRIHQRERAFSSNSAPAALRAIRLPKPVNATEAVTSLEAGVLRIRLPVSSAKHSLADEATEIPLQA